MSIFRKNNKGFTLVELLVVISIIGILSSFAIVSLNSARIKARDALRKGDMAQLRTALNLYYDDNLSYPVCNPGDVWDPSDPYYGINADDGADCYNDVLAPSLTPVDRPLMLEAPVDPRNEYNESSSQNPVSGNDIYLYRYVSNNFGQQYAIIYHLEEDPATPQFIRGF